MTNRTVDDHYWQTARDVCTTKQLEALELRHRHGYSYRAIAAYLGISFETARDRIKRAEQITTAAITP